MEGVPSAARRGRPRGGSLSKEPIAAVDWLGEDDVGALRSITERDTGETRWKHVGDRADGHRLSRVELDGATYDISHDARGRVLEGANSTMVYGPRGRLVMADGAGQHERYLYDAAGRLVQIVNGKQQTLVWDGDQMIAALDLDGNTDWEAVFGAGRDQIVEFESFELGLSGRFVATTDHRNSVVGWLDADTSELEDIIEYTPQGRVRLLAPDGTERCVEQGTGRDCVNLWDPPVFGFAGAFRSNHTGLIYMRNRWYSPTLGQFLTHDPLGYVDSYNLYAYAAFDPINFWDPYGLGSQGFAPTEEDYLEMDEWWNRPNSVPPYAKPERNAVGRITGYRAQDPTGSDPERHFDATGTLLRRILATGRVEESPLQADDLLGLGVGTATVRGAKGLRYAVPRLGPTPDSRSFWRYFHRNQNGTFPDKLDQPYIDEFVTAFERRYPGRDYRVNMERPNMHDKTTELDFETDNVILEFKTGRNPGLHAQIRDRIHDPVLNPHEKVCVGVMCELDSKHIRRGIEAEGGIASEFDIPLLLDLIAPDP